MSSMFAPIGLVHELRHFHGASPDLLDSDLDGFQLKRLPWGSRNRCYAWRVPHLPDWDPHATVCLKLYTSDPSRAWCEAVALQHLAQQQVADVPRFLWHDLEPTLPAATMTWLDGNPISATPMAPPHVLDAIVATVRGIHALPLGPFDNRPRGDAPLDVLHDLTVEWPKALSAHDDSLSCALLPLATRWIDLDDAATLREPATRVLSPGDPSLDHWLWNVQTNTVHLVDWSATGHSDVCCDAADLIEHPTARVFTDDDWISLLPDLGVHDTEGRRRFLAAQRTSALRWLRELWDQRQVFPNKLADQHDRVRALMRQPWL
ncbi:aminoglycoside phosphotransferase family protein [Kibdelosporangium philippinense]|uniref:Aminoglycoside phosphotransferase family protein n=1 Tax=Kibdelosporangium philippinense TaxID=211113 RepID=A0ABS8ZGG3_9PSEU|nr:aminoglycoside phosphotransferase family protein [Kibdelosporangium philippinense]MCE7006923.1 aminoglycoside phosphotransferase family protein [Kibdelosporangium philippinense]